MNYINRLSTKVFSGPWWDLKRVVYVVKKNILKLFLISVLVLTACQKDINTEKEHLVGENNISINNVSAESNDVNNTNINNASADNKDVNYQNNLISDLQMKVENGGIFMNPWSTSAYGCYEIMTNTDYTANILYTDVETKQRIYLSSNLASSHNSADDTSWIDDTIGGVATFVADEKLYLFKGGYDTKAPSLWRADLSGANREKIVDFSDYADQPKTFAGNNQVWYTLISKDEEETALVKVDLMNKTVEEVTTFPYLTLFLMSAYDDILILKTIDVPRNSQMDAYESYKQGVHIVLSYSLSTGKLTELMSWKQNTSFEYFEGAYMYCFDVSADKLICLDMRNGKEEIIGNGFINKNSFITEISTFHGIYDEKVILDADGKRYIWDLTSDKTVEMQMLEGYVYPWIIGTYDDQYLVTTEYLEVPVETKDPNGNPMVTTMIMSNLALIDIDDYWNQNYDFIPIKNIFLEQ